MVTSSTDVNMPAIELLALSSIVDDDRTTMGRWPLSETIDHVMRRSASMSPWPRSPAKALVVTTMPASTGSPAAAARASAAALAPAVSVSDATGSSRATTALVLTTCRYPVSIESIAMPVPSMPPVRSADVHLRRKYAR